MKKKILLIASFISFGAFAQGSLEKEKFQLNAGIGASDWGTLVYGGADYGIHEDITLGGELSYRSDNHFYGVSEYKTSVIGIGVNGNYHFNKLLKIPSQWDVYAGAGLTYYVWNYDNDLYKRSNDSNIGAGLQTGGRYFFTDKFGVNVELSADHNANVGAKAGITYKL